VNEVEIGVQTYTYRKFDIPAMIKELEGTGITALEMYPAHLGPATAGGALEDARRRLSDAGLRVCGTGVCGFSSDDPDAIRASLEFAARLGADYVSMDVPPDDAEAKQMLVSMAGDLGLLLAIHNHGPGHHYDTAESVLRSCEGYDWEAELRRRAFGARTPHGLPHRAGDRVRGGPGRSHPRHAPDGGGAQPGARSASVRGPGRNHSVSATAEGAADSTSLLPTIFQCPHTNAATNSRACTTLLAAMPAQTPAALCHARARP